MIGGHLRSEGFGLSAPESPTGAPTRRGGKIAIGDALGSRGVTGHLEAESISGTYESISVGSGVDPANVRTAALRFIGNVLHSAADG